MSMSIDLNDKGKLKVEQSVKAPKIQPKPDAPPSTKKAWYRRITKKQVLVSILILLTGGAIFAYSRLASFSESIGLKISAGSIVNTFTNANELQTTADGLRTNVMFVGIDTRNTNQGLQNTDTIILLSYHHDSAQITQISIPRDTYVRLLDQEWYVKINGIYNRYENQQEGEGLSALQEIVEEYTGEEIQYYAMVDVNGLSDVVDLLGGVDVYVENSFTDYAYPNEENPLQDYQVVSFTAGPQTLDGDSAVKYARSRKSLDNGEGSDFARARRQQILLEAIKDKVLSTETLLSPNRLIELVGEFKNNVTLSEFTTEDIKAGLDILQENGDTDTYSIVLDPTVAGGRVIGQDLVPEAYSIGPINGLGETDDLHSYLDSFFQSPGLYSYNPTIYVYDYGAGFVEASNTADQIAADLEHFTVVFQGTLTSASGTGNYIYANSDDTTAGHIGDVADIASLNGYQTDKPEDITTSLNSEDIVILLGADDTLAQ